MRELGGRERKRATGLPPRGEIGRERIRGEKGKIQTGEKEKIKGKENPTIKGVRRQN